ncbi:MAG: DUF1836 domain-containing protein [Oscillospiraceae bacterium]|nr:DUF1836 domain-containing protein [Oscillospiraceae bacterium]
MKWTIPGTVLEITTAEIPALEDKFQNMFLAGGMVLSQVSAVSGLEPYAVQNWVKRGFLSAPVQKRYNLQQLCRILTINMLKSCLTLEQICGLLEYVNGNLQDESDDLILDSDLYFLFVKLAAYHRQMNTPQGRDQHLQQLLDGYPERVPGAKQRIGKVLTVMLTAWAAAQLQQQAQYMISQLKPLQ